MEDTYNWNGKEVNYHYVMREDKVFEVYEWNGEVETTKVVIIFKDDPKFSNAIIRAVEPFLLQLGFRIIEKQKPPRKRNPVEFVGWIIDMVEKTAKQADRWEINRDKKEQSLLGNILPIAWPSQLSTFMYEKRGALTAVTFNI